MKQDKSIEENDKEFISIWSTGKLTIEFLIYFY